MKPSVFRSQIYRNQSLEHFLDMVHASQMTYWASDLLSKGLKPDEIRQAVRRGMMACERGGLDFHRHFKLMYTSSSKGVSFDDCKMSRLGYRLTILNANPRNKYVARVQIKLAQRQV
jgi:hypothetical protein